MYTLDAYFCGPLDGAVGPNHPLHLWSSSSYVEGNHYFDSNNSEGLCEYLIYDILIILTSVCLCLNRALLPTQPLNMCLISIKILRDGMLEFKKASLTISGMLFPLLSYLHFLHGLHMDAAALAVFHEGQVQGVHQDDSSQARSIFALHVFQKHLSFVCFVTDDSGDLS